jgi:hypothetical protein
MAALKVVQDPTSRAGGGAPTAARGARTRSVAIIAYAVAMAYLEAAVVVYLQHALAIEPAAVFPVRDPGALGGLGTIELGREAATLVMLGSVGWLAGRGGLERLAWSAVAFGAWDIGYYGWLWVFSGWPPSPSTWDLLFLIPVPWVGPVWAPIAVSAALVGFGLAAARQLRAGPLLDVGRAGAVTVLAGGLLVVVSFTADAGRIAAGGMPTTFPWPVFVAGMALAAWGALTTLRAPGPGGAGAASAKNDRGRGP